MSRSASSGSEASTPTSASSANGGTSPAADGHRVGRFFDLQKKKYERCLYVGFDCEEKPIRAHSIQNGKVLDLLQRDHHVIAPLQRVMPETGPVTEFKLVGRNEASTFTGLCARHDQELFRTADNEPLDVDNGKQLNELAYRAVMRELHACVEGAYRIDLLHQDNIRKGLVPEDAPNPSEIFWDKGWRVIRYRGTHFDKQMAKGKQPPLVHRIIELEDQNPTLAAASLFSVEIDSNGDIVGPTVTVVPVDAGRTIAIVSYPRKHRVQVEKQLAALFAATELEQKKSELSRIVIERMENFVLAPDFHDGWSADKTKRIVEAYEGSAALDAGTDFSLF